MGARAPNRARQAGGGSESGALAASHRHGVGACIHGGMSRCEVAGRHVCARRRSGRGRREEDPSRGPTRAAAPRHAAGWKGSESGAGHTLPPTSMCCELRVQTGHTRRAARGNPCPGGVTLRPGPSTPRRFLAASSAGRAVIGRCHWKSASFSQEMYDTPPGMYWSRAPKGRRAGAVRPGIRQLMQKFRKIKPKLRRNSYENLLQNISCCPNNTRTSARPRSAMEASLYRQILDHASTTVPRRPFSQPR